MLTTSFVNVKFKLFSIFDGLMKHICQYIINYYYLCLSLAYEKNYIVIEIAGHRRTME